MGHAAPVALGMPSQPRPLYTSATYLVHRPGSIPRPALVLNVRKGRHGGQEAYISFKGQDKRLDTWVPETEIGEQVIEEAVAGPSSLPMKSPGGSKRRKLAKPLSSPARASSFSGDGARPATRSDKEASVLPSPDREHAAMTRVRNFEDARFGEYLIRTWYYSPYPLPPEEVPAQSNSHPPHRPLSVAAARKGKAPASAADVVSQEVKGKNQAPSRSIGDLLHGGVGKGGVGARGRLWVCDLCFKYMRSRAAWEKHSSGCQQFLPPGRRVYQRGSFTIWEVDGAAATLYCQNLSLFGKLFIDHKSVFFHVENFLFYIICDASTSYRDQPMAFFSKEKLSFDDYNLACIVTFPPYQGSGFGKLLIEFSYYLTKHPATRPISLSPGTPERPLSDLGLKGYLAYWSSTILRYLRQALAAAPKLEAAGEGKGAVNGAAAVEKRGRSTRRRPSTAVEGVLIDMAGHSMLKHDIPRHKGQYSLILTLSALAAACHLRVDDTAFTLAELGLLRNRRTVTVPAPSKRIRTGGDDDEEQEYRVDAGDGSSGGVPKEAGDGESLGEWEDVEVVISRDEVERLCGVWGVRECPMLDTEFVLL